MAQSRGGGGGHFRDRHGLSSLATRAVGHTGSRGPAPDVPPCECSPRAHTHKQPASCISERPGLTRRQGTGRVGIPGRIQLHLFTPVRHGLVVPGG